MNIFNCARCEFDGKPDRALDTTRPIRSLLLVAVVAITPLIGLVVFGGQNASEPCAQAADASDKQPTTGDLMLKELEQRGREVIEHPYIPASGHVKRIIAEVYAHPLSPMVPDVGPFDVPVEDYEKILGCFRNARLDEKRPSPYHQEMGTVRLILDDGATFRICWYSIGHYGRLAFSCGGIRYRSEGDKFADDETLAVDIILRKIYASLEKAKANETKDAPPVETSLRCSALRRRRW
jgi:hypothetical protein